MNAFSISKRSTRPMWLFMLTALAVLSLVFVWRGAGRMLRMQSQAASNAEFAELKAEDAAKIVVEVVESLEGRIRGRLLEKRDETHYTRTSKLTEIAWGKDTAVVMGKAADVHAGAIVHVTGKVAADHSVQAAQIVILTGYVQVK